MSDERELPNSDAIQVMTMKVSKGLEFPVVALPGVGHMPAPGEDEKEAARVFYVAATRATQRLVVGVGGDGVFERRLVDKNDLPPDQSRSPCSAISNLT